MLSLEQLYTDDTNDNNNDGDDDEDNDDDNDTWRTNYDCIGSLACMPNEPKIQNPERARARSLAQSLNVNALAGKWSPL